MGAPTDINGTFRTEQLGDTLLLTPLINLAKLEDARVRNDGQTVIDQFAAAQLKHVVVDFQHTDHYSSAALGYFVKLRKRSQMQGGHMAFYNLSPQERKALHRTQLDTLFSICETRDEALDAVRNRGDEHP